MSATEGGLKSHWMKGAESCSRDLVARMRILCFVIQLHAAVSAFLLNCLFYWNLSLPSTCLLCPPSYLTRKWWALWEKDYILRYLTIKCLDWSLFRLLFYCNINNLYDKIPVMWLCVTLRPKLSVESVWNDGGSYKSGWELLFRISLGWIVMGIHSLLPSNFQDLSFWLYKLHLCGVQLQ